MDGSSITTDVEQSVRVDTGQVVLEGTLGVTFTQPPAQGTRFIHRSHPLPGVLADGLLEATLADAGLPADNGQGAPDPVVLGRAGCWATHAVERQTTVLLLRLRHQLSVHRSAGADTLLIDEAAAVALAAFGAFAGAENWPAALRRDTAIAC